MANDHKCRFCDDGCSICDHTGYDTEGTDEIVCPWCGYEFSDSWEYSGRDYEENEVCPDCGKKFTLEVNRSVTYTTKRQNENEK